MCMRMEHHAKNQNIFKTIESVHILCMGFTEVTKFSGILFRIAVDSTVEQHTREPRGSCKRERRGEGIKKTW